MPTFTLNQLQYSDDRTGILRIYVFHPSGRGYEARQYFSRHIRYPEEEVSVGDAKAISDAAVSNGREVRITNGGDELVFHAKDGVVLFPAEGADAFWRSIL